MYKALLMKQISINLERMNLILGRKKQKRGLS
jgi:hypothetical protein